MVFLPNATLGTNRRATTPTNGSYGMQPYLSGLAAHVEPASFGERFTQGQRAIEVDWIVTLDFDAANPLDIRVDDEFTGWNPLNQTPAPLLRIGRVGPYFGGPLPHLECWCIDLRSS